MSEAGRSGKEQEMKVRANYSIRIAILVLSLVAMAWAATAESARVRQYQNPPPDKPAEQVYKNIQIFKGVPAPQLLKAMNFFKTSLGVDCTHCHVQGEFDKDDKPAKQTARKMIRMVGSIGSFLKENSVNGSATCFMCHRGQVKPVIIPPNWKPRTDNKLPPDQADKPAEAVYKNIQVLKGEKASNWMTVMSFMAASLGVDCTHCHVQGEFDKDDKPAKQTARKMLQMVTKVNKDFYGGSGPITCYACHKGEPHPKAVPPQ
jgi:Photosynthetic reaction centre cytochrome C subunit